MRQIKFHRTELSLSATCADVCALSDNQGLCLQKLQETLVFNEQLIGKATLYRRTEMKQVKFHRTKLSRSATGAQLYALSENQGLSLQSCKSFERKIDCKSHSVS